MLGHNLSFVSHASVCLCVVGEEEKGGNQKRKRERVSVRGGRRREGQLCVGLSPALGLPGDQQLNQMTKRRRESERERKRMRKEGREAGKGRGDAVAVMGDDKTNQQSYEKVLRSNLANKNE